MTSESIRTIYLIVQNDGTDEINNLHSIPVEIDAHQDAYVSVLRAFQDAYGEEEYLACDICGEGNAYRGMPRQIARGNNLEYLVTRTLVNDCCGAVRWKQHETIEDPLGRSFIPMLFDPDAQPLGTDGILNIITDNPEACQAFMPLSSVLQVLDVWRGLVPLAL